MEMMALYLDGEICLNWVWEVSGDDGVKWIWMVKFV